MEDKQEIACPHFGRCSGCVLQKQIDKLAPFEELSVFFATHHISLPPLVTGPANGWRQRAKLVVAQNQANGIDIGLYRAHSHDVEPIPNCQVHHPVLQQALNTVWRVLEEEGICAYKETKHTGLLRYLLLALEEKSQKIQLTFVATERVPAYWNTCVQRLPKEKPLLWHSIWLNHNARADNVIWGDHWDLLRGERWLEVQIGKASMSLHPGSFFQANPPMFRRVIEDLTLWMPQGAKLVELYSGCGVMGLHLGLAKGCDVTFCERNPIAKRCFDASYARIPPDLQQQLRVHYLVESTENALHLLEDAQVVLVDPPRKGLSSALIAALRESKVETQLFYMSCGWQTLMRDCAALCKFGWRIKHAKTYLFFPGTEQIETLVHLEKRVI